MFAFEARFFVEAEAHRTQVNSRAFAWHRLATAARAVRPASLAASARTAAHEALVGWARSGCEPSAGEVRFGKALLHRVLVGALPHRFSAVQGGALEQEAACWPCFSAGQRLYGAPETRGCAGSSHGEACGLASRGTHRTMQAGRAVLRARPNPSIERTSPGKPGAASHLKR
jgi:hypothetical protein